MVRGFSTKKIKALKTLGEILKTKRAELEISLASAEIGSKVRAKYLAAIENSRWQELPQEVYVRGFVLAYAKFLGLDKNKMLELYDTEAMIYRQKTAAQISYNQTFKDKKVLITPKVLAYAAVICFVVGLFSYISFQVVRFAGNPNLKILTPNNNAVLSIDTVSLAGITDANAYVAVNGEGIPVASDGHFVSELKLHSGVNVIKIQAVNKIKKETSEVYTIEYKPKTALNNSQLVNQ